MYPFIYIHIHMLEARVKQLEKQAREDFRYSETLLARLAPFLRKKATEKEAAKKEATEKEAAEKEAAENSVARVIFTMSYFYF
jgi:peptidoglycan hydrolase CwlO-like protein